MPHGPRSRSLSSGLGLPAVAAIATAGLLLGLTPPAQGTAPVPAERPSPAQRVATEEFRGLGDSPLALPEIDRRGTTFPTLAQKRAAAALGADLRWNEFGTPASLLPRDGSLGKATSKDAVTAARSWLLGNRGVFGLSAADVRRLELVNNQRFAQSPARAVLFRQRFGGDLTPAIGSMVTVGVARGEIAYVSSSLVKGTSAPPAATLTPVQGWLRAARNVGAQVPSGALSAATQRAGWTRFTVTGMAQEQLARTRALALADGTVRPVIEANVVDVQGASVSAYTVLVDARTGAILYRRSAVDQANETETFNGALTANDCGPAHPVTVPDDQTRQLRVAVNAFNPANDIVVKIFKPNGDLATSGDLGTSPETATLTGNPIPQGTYTIRVCPYDDPTAPLLPPFEYVGSATLSESEGDAPAAPYPPMWRYFPTNPTPDFRPGVRSRGNVVGCWVTRVNGVTVPDCTEPTGALENLASRSPWDANGSGAPTYTSLGNNASTREAWASPLTPGGTAQAPQSPERKYLDVFEDRWNDSKCDPSEIRAGGNDILPSVTNLFVGHNRMHDYSYFLGFTEANYNLQTDNYGRGGRGEDPEIGNAQAGASSGGQPTYLGRDNANQIALQDGVPGITNQYLFQPIAGAFYAPCADGGLDMGIVGHEYTHAISNRMVGGPDEGLSSEQGRAMGESWGDLVAGEYQFSHGYRNGGNVFAVGLYATGNKRTAIRNYAANRNPLNYAEVGYDSTGAQVHADGEIWTGTQWRVRQALVRKYNRRFPYANKTLQLRCASGGSGRNAPLPANRCPGNRRWVQLMFDSMLLQQGATSMLDARDAMIAADRMRFGGKNKALLWAAFARSGMGRGAATPTADSSVTKPSFAALRGNRTARFVPVLPNGRRVNGAFLFIGTYHARSTAVADTNRRTKKLDDLVNLAPGRYRAVVQGPAIGIKRVTLRITKGRSTQPLRVVVQRNLASTISGAKVVGSSAGSRNAKFLIDSSEATNWGGVNETQNVDAKNPFVTVDLPGSKPVRFRRMFVSALLRPPPASDEEIPLLAEAEEDPDSGSRFTALRKFALETCVRDCGKASSWRRVFTSKDDAFPSVRPRPTSPTLAGRTFLLRQATRARQVRFVALENQCTGYAGYAGEQDNDPFNDTDCKTASDRGTIVHAAELQLFAR